MGLDHYHQTYFHAYHGQPVVVDSNPRLLMLPWAIPRVRAICSNARFIVVLRDPISRAFSQWALPAILGLEARSFVSYIVQNLVRWQQRGNVFDLPETEALWRITNDTSTVRKVCFDCVLESGCYAINLSRWLAVFPRSQFLILTTDQLNRPETVSAIYQHVGVDPSRGLDVAPNSNSWRRYIGSDGEGKASGMVPDTSSISLLEEFYTPQDVALCQVMKWSKTPWLGQIRDWA